MTNKPQPDILIVDDAPENLDVLSHMLTYQGYNVRVAVDGETAIEAAQKVPPDLILLDVSMPGLSGYEVCARLKQDERTAQIPVIFISALSDIEDKIQAFHMGGVDYVSKPFHTEEVIARVKAQLTLYDQRREIERLMLQQKNYYENLSELKDRLLSTASHDLKEPLAIITGYARLLDSPGALDDSELLTTSVKEIRKAAERMNTLINDLLDLAKIETGIAIQPVDTDLNPFLQQCVDDFRFQKEEKHIDLAFLPGVENIKVSFDPARLSQVIHNLISNAIKYTPEGGQVRLTTEVVGDQVVIHVTDTGLGIPAEALSRLFDKFYRVPDEKHAAVKGIGLGLAIAKAIVEQHHGEITVESEVGKGSTFSVALPLSVAAE